MNRNKKKVKVLGREKELMCVYGVSAVDVEQLECVAGLGTLGLWWMK